MYVLSLFFNYAGVLPMCFIFVLVIFNCKYISCSNEWENLLYIYFLLLIGSWLFYECK